MNPSESFGFAEASASAATSNTDSPFVNNAEIVFGDADLSGSGIGESNPDQSPTQSASASAAPGGSALVGAPGSLSSPASASGQPLMLALVLGALAIAGFIALHHK